MALIEQMMLQQSGIDMLLDEQMAECERKNLTARSRINLELGGKKHFREDPTLSPNSHFLADVFRTIETPEPEEAPLRLCAFRFYEDILLFAVLLICCERSRRTDDSEDCRTAGCFHASPWPEHM